MKKIFLGIIALTTIAQAEMTQVVENKNIKISLGTQFKNMETKELVYKDKNSDVRLSELDWRMDNATMIGGEVELTPTDRFSIKLGAYTSFGTNEEYMDDYDWLYYSTGTGDDDFDKHTRSRTELDYATDINLDLSYKFYDGKNNDFFILTGIDYTHNKWSSYGAHGVYTKQPWDKYPESLKPGDKYPVNDNDSIMGLSYEQTQLIGYLGLGYEFTYKKLGLGTQFKKGIGTTKSTDEHVMRSLTFEDEMDATYSEASIYFEYNFTPNFNGKLEDVYVFSESNGHGDETMTDNIKGTSKYLEEKVGFKNTSNVVRLSLAYSF